MSTEASQRMVGDDDLVESSEGITQEFSKRRKLTSKVWKDFEKIKGPSGEDIARCKHCKREYVAGNSKGTSHLIKHLAGRCPGLKYTDPNASRHLLTPKNVEFDQERSRMDFARMIIKHNYPFNMAEHEFFEIFCNNLQPMFKLVSRNTVRADVIDVYQIDAYKKSELEQYLEELVFPSNENFNILHWWKVNSAKFPTLARMARDILAVPATTVASEAAFSTGGRVIDETRASLLPDIVEALVTANDWIESCKKINVEGCLVGD